MSDNNAHNNGSINYNNSDTHSTLQRWNCGILCCRRRYCYGYESICRDNPSDLNIDHADQYPDTRNCTRRRWLLIFVVVLLIFLALLIGCGWWIWNENLKSQPTSDDISELTKEIILATLRNNTRLKAGNEKFVRPPLTESLECGRLFSNDENDYIEQMAENRIKFKDPIEEFPMDCEAIRSRNYFADEPASPAEANYPLAEIRVIYEDYILAEMELAAGYAPQNWYCFAIDKKASTQFHERMRSLAECFPNIILNLVEYMVDSGGHNMTSSYVQCLEELLSPSKEWKYVTLLQNNDVSLKTNREMVQIFKWLNGANDVETQPKMEERYDPSMNWSFEALHLFQNESRNVLNSKSGFPPTLVFAKGSSEGSLTREMVDFLLNELDLSELLRRIESFGYGTDETMIPSLNAADAVQAPGGFTDACIDAGVSAPFVTRMAIWSNEEIKCATGYMRHAVCIYGVEDLRHRLEDSPYLFANKMLPNFDFGAIACMYERLLIDP